MIWSLLPLGKTEAETMDIAVRARVRFRFLEPHLREGSLTW